MPQEPKDYKTDFDTAESFVLNSQFYAHIALLNALTVDMEGMKAGKDPLEVLELYKLCVDKLQQVLVAAGKIEESELNEKIKEFKVNLKAQESDQEYTSLVDEKKAVFFKHSRIASKRLGLLMQAAFEGKAIEVELHH